MFRVGVHHAADRRQHERHVSGHELRVLLELRVAKSENDIDLQKLHGQVSILHVEPVDGEEDLARRWRHSEGPCQKVLHRLHPIFIQVIEALNPLDERSAKTTNVLDALPFRTSMVEAVGEWISTRPTPELIWPIGTSLFVHFGTSKDVQAHLDFGVVTT